MEDLRFEISEGLREMKAKDGLLHGFVERASARHGRCHPDPSTALRAGGWRYMGVEMRRAAERSFGPRMGLRMTILVGSSEGFLTRSRQGRDLRFGMRAKGNGRDRSYKSPHA